ncbi:MAG: tRNA pseudouridine(55) synthase TruB [bacterium]|nr:tRNA pseudouridine(55) synthase TruB [bacterium]
MFGFININKPKGITSHDVVAILRRILKIKQIGHTGTLDPFAEGVLPICIGKATRLIEFLEDEKAYIGTVQFGKSTDTYDVDGKIINTSEKQITFEDLENALKDFRGEIEQTPPIYSAIKINGKKLYEYAREGKDVEIKPRKVYIQKLEILSFDEIKQQAELYIECSKGTYIRSIANDLGLALQTYGYLTKLVRVKAGKFTLRESIELNKLNSKEKCLAHLISPIEKLNYPKYELTKAEFDKVSHGNPIQIESQNGITILIYENKIVAVANIDENLAKILKVFI